MKAFLRTEDLAADVDVDTRPVLLVPAYNPGPALPQLIQRMLATGALSGAIVVDDGSAASRARIFDRCRQIPQVEVVAHPRNRGKGAALKTGLALAARRASAVGVVTADADGQHVEEDVARVARALERSPSHLVLAARQFGKDVPLRSRFGNLLTRRVMRVVTGQRFTDTQTGLRGIPRGLIAPLLSISADGYEFELDALLRCPREQVVEEVPIRTIYIDGNASSHFDPILDSMRIYMVLLRFLFASLGTAVVDNLVFMLAYLLIPQVGVCQALGRAAAISINFALNRRAVFLSDDRVWRTLPRYLALCLCSGLLSYGLIRALQTAGMSVLTAKLCAESLLFLVNFVALRKLVFAR